MKTTVNTNHYYGSTLSTPCGYGIWFFRFMTSNGHTEECYQKPAYYTEAVKWARKRAKELQSHYIIVLP